MGKVQLKIPPWMASWVSAQSSDWFVLEKEIGEGATIGDLLAEVASSHADFRKAVFNPNMREINDQILVVLNDNQLEFTDVTEVKLNDGDIITLLTIFAGG